MSSSGFIWLDCYPTYMINSWLISNIVSWILGNGSSHNKLSTPKDSQESFSSAVEYLEYVFYELKRYNSLADLPPVGLGISIGFKNLRHMDVYLLDITSYWSPYAEIKLKTNNLEFVLNWCTPLVQVILAILSKLEYWENRVTDLSYININYVSPPA